MSCGTGSSHIVLTPKNKPRVTGNWTNGDKNVVPRFTPASSYIFFIFSACFCKANVSPFCCIFVKSSCALSNCGCRGNNLAEFRRPAMMNGKRMSRQNTLPATIVQNHGIPVETLISSIDHRIMAAGVRPVRPMAAKSPYCNAAGRWFRAFSMISDENDNGSVALIAAVAACSKDALVTSVLVAIVLLAERAGTVLEKVRVCTTARKTFCLGKAPKG